MESEKFDLVFKGQILPKHELAVVKANMASLFKVPLTQIEALFSGKPVVLKRNLDLTAANRYRVAIKNAGARVDLQKTGESPKAVVNDKPATPAAPATPAPAANVSESARTLDGMAAVAEPSETQTQVTAKAIDFGYLTLSAPGSDLLTANERAPEVVLSLDLSAMSLREGGGNLVDETELTRALPIVVGNLDVDVLPAGSELLKSTEKQPKVAVVVPELKADLAPLGEHLAAAKPSYAQAPNVDHLRLAD